MTTFDYNNATSQSFEPIPQDTVCALQMTIRPGGAGEEGLLKQSNDGWSQMLDCEFVVVDAGDYERRKLWNNFILAGANHARAVEVSRSKLRQILESARGIRPDDLSPEARTARIATLRDFDGMRFVGKIGIEGERRDSSGKVYPPRNVLICAITPDRAEWRRLEQPVKPSQGMVSASAVAQGNGHAQSV